jgi:ComF family protein
MLEKLWENFLDLLFPPHCVNCGKIGIFLCEDCSGKILQVKSQTCPTCNRISKTGTTCPSCRRKSSLNGAISYGYFKDPILKEIIHGYKYQRIGALSKTLASFLVDLIREEEVTFDVVTFVPITKVRESWRGFNQAELLAKEITREFEVPLVKLIKTKETKTQVGLTRKERLKNVSGSFRILKPANLAGKKVLLVDDVITTGTTLSECAKILKKARAKRVQAVVIAKE